MTLTYNEDNLNEYVFEVDLAFVGFLILILEGGIVRNFHGHAEANYENEPIPPSFSSSIVWQDEALLLYCGCLVFWQVYSLLAIFKLELDEEELHTQTHIHS